MESFSCRVCGDCHFVNDIYEMFAIHGFATVKNIDGPNLICADCINRHGVNTFIEDGYNNAYIEEVKPVGDR
jgi:hypothetical protein